MGKSWYVILNHFYTILLLICDMLNILLHTKKKNLENSRMSKTKHFNLPTKYLYIHIYKMQLHLQSQQKILFINIIPLGYRKTNIN